MNVKRTLMAVLRYVTTLSPVMSVLVVQAIIWQMIHMDVMVTNYNIIMESIIINYSYNTLAANWRIGQFCIDYSFSIIENINFRTFAVNKIIIMCFHIQHTK